jgi:hypothetical protein
MEKYSLSIGLNDKDTKTQRVSTLEAYKIVENVIIEKIGGGSIFEGRGIYKHENGQIVLENTLLVELFGCEENQVIEVVEVLKLALNQESIVLQVERINSRFI